MIVEALPSLSVLCFKLISKWGEWKSSFKKKYYETINIKKVLKEIIY